MFISPGLIFGILRYVLSVSKVCILLNITIFVDSCDSFQELIYGCNALKLTKIEATSKERDNEIYNLSTVDGENCPQFAFINTRFDKAPLTIKHYTLKDFDLLISGVELSRLIQTLAFSVKKVEKVPKC